MRMPIWVGVFSVVILAACRPPATPPSGVSSGAAETAQAPSAAPVVDREHPTERVVAGVGVGKQGRSLDKRSGPIVEPVKALFATKERLTFDVQLKHAMDLYKATHGRLPKSHEEFMAQIVKFNKIKLPALPEGHKYIYDPQRGELMVERPAQ